MEKAALLVPVQRIVRGVKVEDDLLGRPFVGFQEQRHRQRLDRGFVAGNLVVARRLLPAQFQTVQRRLARHRGAVLASCRKLSRQHRHQRVVPQFIVIVEVLIAQRNPEHPLADQSAHRVLHQILAAVVAKTGRKSIHQTDRSVARAQKQRTRIRGHQPGIEGRLHNPAFNDSKIELFCATLCRHRGAPRIIPKSFSLKNFR